LSVSIGDAGVAAAGIASLPQPMAMTPATPKNANAQ
jgi:hypothetical protein